MRKHIDFIFDDCGKERKIIRFYPRRSHVHGFGEDCPHDWQAVYKVYYAWSVLHQYRCFEDAVWESCTVFESNTDECSVLENLGKLVEIVPIGKTLDVCALGDGVDWQIKHIAADEKFKQAEQYQFVAWKHYDNVGYRFWLNVEDTARFVKYLHFVNEYMLAHSEPI